MSGVVDGVHGVDGSDGADAIVVRFVISVAYNPNLSEKLQVVPGRAGGGSFRRKKNY